MEYIEVNMQCNLMVLLPLVYLSHVGNTQILMLIINYIPYLLFINKEL